MPRDSWSGENCLVLRAKSAKNIMPVALTTKTRTTMLFISASLVALSSERMIKEKENSKYIILPGQKKRGFFLEKKTLCLFLVQVNSACRKGKLYAIFFKLPLDCKADIVLYLKNFAVFRFLDEELYINVE